MTISTTSIPRRSTKSSCTNAVVTVAVAALALVLSGCAAHYTPEATADPYGFFSGIWHGIVFPFALLANILSWLLSLAGISFLQSVEIIGRPNTGLWYYVGFFLGFCTYASAGAK